MRGGICPSDGSGGCSDPGAARLPEVVQNAAGHPRGPSGHKLHSGRCQQPVQALSPCQRGAGCVLPATCQWREGALPSIIVAYRATEDGKWSPSQQGMNMSIWKIFNRVDHVLCRNSRFHTKIKPRVFPHSWTRFIANFAKSMLQLTTHRQI